MFVCVHLQRWCWEGVGGAHEGVRAQFRFECASGWKACQGEELAKLPAELVSTTTATIRACRCGTHQGAPETTDWLAC